MAQKPISQIKLPNGSTYNIDKGIYYIEGTGSTDTTNKVATWLGSHDDIPAYYNGLTILYKISTAGSTTTTLNINSLGAISVVKNVNTAISTSYGVGSIVTLTYTTDGDTAYWKCADYDANTKTTTGTSNKASTKLFLTGATSQTSSGTTTYSNSKVYIGTDNCLYSNGAKVLTSYTDTNDKVTNELATTTKAYITGTTSATTNTGTQIFDTGVYLDTTAGQLVATTFKGALDGNAKTATTASSVAWSKVTGRPESLTDLTNDLKSLTIGSKSYNGSSAITVTAADLGLANAMKFLGTTATAISDGSTTSSISIDGSTITVAAGNVVLYDGFEYVWTGSAWEKLGDETSFKVKQTAVTNPTANGNATAFIDTISQDANGKITVTKKNVSFPTINDATLTIQKNGTNVATFTANSATNATANITVPTGAAADKGVDTSISAASTSTNLPTSKAVAAFVEGKGYITSYSNGYHTTGSWNGLTYTATANGGAGELKFTVPTGTSSTTVAVGNHTHSSYVNQNAFSNVKVGDTTIAADTVTDTLTLVGSNITLTPDATNDKITIGITKANVTAALGYTPPTTDTNTHYTTKLFATSSTGTAHATTTNGNTYLRLFDDSTARQSIKITGSGATTVTSDANGVITISSSKFSGNYNDLTNKPTIPTVPTSLKNPNSLTIQGNGTTSFTYDGSAAKTLNIKAGSNVTVSSDTSGNITIAATNTTYTFNGAVSTIKDNNLTANRALISDSNGKVAVSAVTSTELGYLDGVTSSIQTQLNGKLGSTATAAAAKKVTNKLTIKLNGGSTEGTNLFTFDGSAAKTLNITASSIGAAPAYTYQTTDPGAGSSLTTGKLLIVYS